MYQDAPAAHGHSEEKGVRAYRIYLHQILEQSEDEEKVQAEASGIGPVAPLLAYTYTMCPLSRLFFDGARMIHVVIMLEQNTEDRRQETENKCNSVRNMI